LSRIDFWQTEAESYDYVAQIYDKFSSLCVRLILAIPLCGSYNYVLTSTSWRRPSAAVQDCKWRYIK